MCYFLIFGHKCLLQSYIKQPNTSSSTKCTQGMCSPLLQLVKNNKSCNKLKPTGNFNCTKVTPTHFIYT